MLIHPNLLPLLISSLGGEASPTPPVPSAVAAVLLLCCSAFFSASETALFSLQPVDRRAMADAGNTRVEAMLKSPRATLATLLIGNETVNITLSSVMAGLMLSLAPELPWLNLVVLPPILLVCGEIMPKVFAMRFNRRAAALIAPPLRIFGLIVTPIRWVLTAVADLFLRMTGGTTAHEEAELREAQLRALIDETIASGSIGASEHEMLHKAFDFGDLTVNRLMTPRPDMRTLRLNDRWEDLLEQIRHEGLSRLPVWHNKADNIIGILVVKSLLPVLRAVHAGERPAPTARDIQRMLLPVRFVPTTKAAEAMLHEFRTERFHMSVVVDEHGNVVGLVTLDDLLSELVGDLLDETDIDDPEVTALGSDVFSVWAGMDIEDFEHRFGVELPEGEYNTVGGFLLDQVGGLPDKGTEVVYKGLLFVVSGVEDRRITEVSVRPIGPQAEGK